MDTNFIVAHGSLLIDASVEEAAGDYLGAERIRYEAYSMVIKMAHALGRGDIYFQPASFLNTYPEYKKCFWIFFHLGSKFAREQRFTETKTA